jgi:hypothetical protein
MTFSSVLCACVWLSRDDVLACTVTWRCSHLHCVCETVTWRCSRLHCVCDCHVTMFSSVLCVSVTWRCLTCTVWLSRDDALVCAWLSRDNILVCTVCVTATWRCSCLYCVFVTATWRCSRLYCVCDCHVTMFLPALCDCHVTMFSPVCDCHDTEWGSAINFVCPPIIYWARG